MRVAVIDFDISDIDYTNFKYDSQRKSKKKVKSELAVLSRGYCMYCYKKVTHTFHLEHYIDKSVAKHYEDYPYNIVNACPDCNSIKNDEKIRKEYIKLHDEIKKNGCKSCGFSKKGSSECYYFNSFIYRRVSNVINPLINKMSDYIEYSLTLKKFIYKPPYKIRGDAHIKVMLSIGASKIVDDVCEDIVEYQKIPKFMERRYNNLISFKVIEYFKMLKEEENIDYVIELAFSLLYLEKFSIT